jgi:hypothetical protein
MNEEQVKRLYCSYMGVVSISMFLLYHVHGHQLGALLSFALFGLVDYRAGWSLRNPPLLSDIADYLGGSSSRCRRCHRPVEKVIYAGLPGKMCTTVGCWAFYGPASYAALIHFSGRVMHYEGSYWRALRHWIKTRKDQDEK